MKQALEEMKAVHLWTLIISCVALVCLTILGAVREDLDGTMILGTLFAIATGTSVGVAGVNGWRERRNEARREEDQTGMRRAVREEMDKNQGVQPNNED